MKFYTLAIEFSVSIGVGVIASFFVISKEIAFLIGIGTFFCIEMIRIRITISNSHDNTERIRGILESFAPADKFSELTLLYGLRAASHLSNGSVKVPKEEIWDFWKDCISRANSSWSALTYTKANDTWELGWGTTTALAIQKERIDNGCHIERVFLFDSDEELQELHPTFKKQHDVGVKVWFLFAEKLLSNRHCKEAYDILGALDVSIADGSWIYRTQLCKKRELVSADATRNQNLLKKSEFLFREAKKMADKYVQK